MRKWLFLLALLLALAVLSQCYFTVDPTEFVYVTQFGAPVATYDGGAADSDAGLHFRWPWPVQSLQRLDRRLQYFDLPAAELLTKDNAGEIDKTLTVKAFVCWRIAGKDADPDAVDRFIRRMGSTKQAEATLGKRLNSQLGAVIGQMRLDDLINTDVDAPLPTPVRRAGLVALLGSPLPLNALTVAGGLATEGLVNPDVRKVDIKLEELRKKLLDSLQQAALAEYGIALVDVQLRRFNHPAQVRESIYETIRSNRYKRVKEYKSEGTRLAENINTTANTKVADLLNQAKAEAKIIKGQADTEADLIRNRAYAEDPEFYVFLKKLEKMQSILGENKTLLLLSTNRPVFELLFAPPRPGMNGLPTPPAPPKAKGKPEDGP